MSGKEFDSDDGFRDRQSCGCDLRMHVRARLRWAVLPQRPAARLVRREPLHRGDFAADSASPAHGSAQACRARRLSHPAAAGRSAEASARCRLVRLFQSRLSAAFPRRRGRRQVSLQTRALRPLSHRPRSERTLACPAARLRGRKLEPPVPGPQGIEHARRGLTRRRDPAGSSHRWRGVDAARDLNDTRAVRSPHFLKNTLLTARERKSFCWLQAATSKHPAGYMRWRAASDK